MPLGCSGLGGEGLLKRDISSSVISYVVNRAGLGGVISSESWYHTHIRIQASFTMGVSYTRRASTYDPAVIEWRWQSALSLACDRRPSLRMRCGPYRWCVVPLLLCLRGVTSPCKSTHFLVSLGRVACGFPIAGRQTNGPPGFVSAGDAGGTSVAVRVRESFPYGQRHRGTLRPCGGALSK